MDKNAEFQWFKCIIFLFPYFEILLEITKLRTAFYSLKPCFEE
ncbi:hypothetical protein [Wolbachia endosymbiont (group B) of Ischnura elegans]|nr:hypothetical protein [Wolbachia endosymbiont (group B) of Ischnura elegans]